MPRSSGAEAAGLAALLQYEADLRRQQSVAELIYFVANESRRVLAYDQMFVLRRGLIGETFQTVGISSLPVVDRNVPLIQAIEAAVAKLGDGEATDQSREFDAQTLTGDGAFDDYPYREWLWQPLPDREGRAFGGLLIARSSPIVEEDMLRLARVADTAAHAWRALSGNRPVRRIRRITKRERIALAILAAAVALCPVRMSALAPVEVVAARPLVIAAPFAGVIRQIDVAPSTPVRKGQALLEFEDVKLRNEMALAAEKLEVARAKVDRSATVAFDKTDEVRDIAIMRAENDLAQAEYNYARDMLAKAKVTAPRDGIAIYGDRRDWEGRAVNVGETIMQIADPNAVAFRIDLPAAEQMALSPGSAVKVWLNSQPLWSLDGRLERASLQARPTPDNVLAFALTAIPVGATPPIGARGTARVYGRWVPLIYSLLRRPIAAVRQRIGL